MSALLVRPAAERFHSQLDWLNSWHTFSFANHHDPAWMGFGPLRVINDDTVAAGQGFGMHPHRNMEIITVMVEGQLNHRDSMGHTAVLRAGEVQRMSAGTGVVHSEINAGDQPCRLLQIWIEPSTEDLPPAYEQKSFCIGEAWTPLLDPERGDGAMAIARPVRMWRAQPTAGRRLSVQLPPGCLGWLQLITGGCDLAVTNQIQPLALQRGDGVGLGDPGRPPTEPQHWELTAAPGGADLLLLALR